MRNSRRFNLIISLLSILCACQPKTHPIVLQSEEIALANPVINIDSVLFTQQASIAILKPDSKATIRYTSDGTVVTKKSLLCSDSLLLSENEDVKFKAFHPDFKPSETVSISVRKVNSFMNPQIQETSTQAKAPYEGKGLNALVNHKKGELDFRANQEWLGYQNEVIELQLKFEETTYCHQIILSTLSDHNSWIFNPGKLELVQNNEVLAFEEIAQPSSKEKPSFQFLELPVMDSLKEVTLKIYMDEIPDWHSGKGTLPWFFMDEMIVE